MSLVFKSSYKPPVQLVSIEVGGEICQAKKCSGNCGEVKALTEFHKEKGGIGGRKSICISCRKEKIKLRKS